MAPAGLIIVRPLAWECASPCRLDSMPRHCKSTTTHTAVYSTQCLSAYAVAAATASEGVAKSASPEDGGDSPFLTWAPGSGLG